MKRDEAPFLQPAQDLAAHAATAAARPTVLAVDDTPANLALLSQLLAGHYRVQLAMSGAKALEIALRRAPDIVLLDVMMPELDGYEVCRRLKADPRTRHVPVIFLTALSSDTDEAEGFAAGAADFVAKPFTPVTLLARLRTHVELKAARDQLLNRNDRLQSELQSRLDEVEKLRDTTLFVMVSLAEFRDEDTGNHVRRTQAYVHELADWLVRQGRAPAGFDAAHIETLTKAASLHDIGKVAVPDSVLLKPGPLTDDEWVQMKAHTVHGATMLQRAADRLGTEAGPLLGYAIQIARHHHEKWDGSGYPDGLRAEAIPLAARLMALADVYDALISRRPYKAALNHAEALRHIEQGQGTHFDPMLVHAVRDVQARLIAIAERWHD